MNFSILFFLIFYGCKPSLSPPVFLIPIESLDSRRGLCDKIVDKKIEFIIAEKVSKFFFSNLGDKSIHISHKKMSGYKDAIRLEIIGNGVLNELKLRCLDNMTLASIECVVLSVDMKSWNKCEENTRY